MRTIYFASNFQNDLFPSNTRTKFESYIQPRDLNYISSGELEVAIKSITFEFELDSILTKLNKSPYVLALKTNLSHHTISSYGWNNIVSIFSINPGNKGILQFEFNNPTFFLTNHQKLCKSEFNIIDLRTGESPNFSFGSPTFIEVVVRAQLKRMKAPFHMLLDSSCRDSLQRFPKNTNMDFTIQLPKRMEFQKDWAVCVKSIHLNNQFNSLRRCNITLTITQSGKTYFKILMLSLKRTFPRDIHKLLQLLNKKCENYLKFNYEKVSEKVNIFCVYSSLNSPFPNSDKLQVTFGEDLVKILGLSAVHSNVTFTQEKLHLESDTRANITAAQPLHFIVCCDIVDESILAGQRVQVLKYFPRKLSNDLVIDQEFSNNDFVKLSLKTFDRIHIRIADLSGKTIKCEPGTATRMQLLFINTNSA